MYQGIEREWGRNYGGTGQWLPGPFAPLEVSVHTGDLPGVYAEAQSTFSMSISPENIVDIYTTNQAAARGPIWTLGEVYARSPEQITLGLSGIGSPTMIYYAIEYDLRGEVNGPHGFADLTVAGPGLPPGSPGPMCVNGPYRCDFQVIGSCSNSGITNDGVLLFVLDPCADAPAYESNAVSIAAHFRIPISGSPITAVEGATWGLIKSLYR